MKEVVNRLKSMLKWSDRLGSDELSEIREIVTLIETTRTYTRSEMEKSFIAGGKANRDIDNPGFDEFLENLDK